MGWDFETVEGQVNALLEMAHLTTPNLYSVGWVPSSYLGYNENLGMSNPDGDQVWVKMPSTGYQWARDAATLLSYELGHSMGLLHVNCAGSEGRPAPDYPWPLAEVDPEVSNGDPMMGCQDDRWVSPYEYCKLLPVFGIPCGLSWLAPHGPQPADQAGPSDGNPDYLPFFESFPRPAGAARIQALDTPPGHHTLTLTATDSRAGKGQVEIQIFIGYRQFIPLLQR